MHLLVGRQRELAWLSGRLAAARSGQGSLVRLVGEPGAGKSRLADALADHARREGVATAWARAWERTSAQPFGVVLDSLESLARAAEGPGLARLEAALETLRDPARITRATLLERAIAALAGSGAPALLVIDDVHAADLDSLELLVALGPALRNTRLMLVCTERSADTGAGPEALAWLDALARVSLDLEVGGLGREALAELIEAMSGQPTDPRFAAALHRATLGNALFVDGLLRAALRDGTLQEGTLQVPADLRRAIAARVARLGAEAGEPLGAAALIGRPFTIALLSRVTGQPAVALEAVLEAATGAGLLLAGGAGQPRTFRHTLVADALAAALAPPERSRLHVAIARALEELEGEQVRPAELALHLRRGVAVVGVAAAMGAIARAAQQASRLRAYEEALRHRRDALALLDEQAPAESGWRLSAVLALGETWLLAGRRADARVRLVEAATLARRLGDDRALGRAALGVAATGEFGQLDTEKIALLEEAATRLASANGARTDGETPGEDGDEPLADLHLRVLEQLVAQLWVDPTGRSRRLELSAQLVELARASGDAVSLVRALDGRFQTLWGPSAWPERAQLLVELRSLAGQLGDPEQRLAIHRHGLLQCFEDGDIEGFAAEIDAFAQLARPLRLPALDETVLQRRLGLALVRGEVAAAERLISELQTVSLAVQNPQAAMGYRFTFSILAADTGRFEALRELVPGFAEDAERLPNLPFIRARLAQLGALCDQQELARHHLERLLARDLADLPEDLTTLACLAMTAETAALLGDAAAARRLVPRLQPFETRVATVGSTLCFGAVARVLGLLFQALGERDRAIEQLTRAHAVHQRMGSPPWRARSAGELAVLLRERDGDDDGARAAVLAAEVEALAAQGMRPVGAPTFPGVTPAPTGRRPPPARVAPEPARLVREGQTWSLTFGGRTVRLRDGRGLHLLAALLAAPGQPHHALDLAGAAEIRSRLDEGPSGSGTELDATARAAYRARLGELRQARDEAEARFDEARALRLRAEQEAIEDQLGASLGLGGRARQSGAAERARVAVAKALERTLKTFETLHPEARAHLARSLRTGLYCSYDPDPGARPEWFVTT